MYKNGNITLVGEIRGLKPQRRAADPTLDELREGLVWVNSTDKALRWFDGSVVHTVASGGSLDDYLSLAGGILTGDLTLKGDAVDALHAVPLQQVTQLLTEKQGNIEGAASTILDVDLAVDRVVVSNAAGKVGVSATTTAELDFLSGVTEPVQEQLNGKQATIGYKPVNAAGDSITGTFDFAGLGTVTGLAAPVNGTDAVRLVDIDYLKADLDFQADVLAVQVDGLLAADDPDFVGQPDSAVRIIVTDIATLDLSFGTIEGLANGDIIVKKGAEFVIAYDVSDKGPGALVWARDLEKFVKYNGTDWTEHGGLSGVTATGGLSKEGNVIRANTGAGVTLLPAGEIGLDLKTSDGLKLVDPTTGEASTATDAVLALRFSETELALGLSGLTLAANGVAKSHLNADVVGNGLAGAAGSALSVKAKDTSIVVDVDGVAVGDLSAVYLSLADGGDVAGPLNVVAPTLPTSATNKEFVDAEVVKVNEAIEAVGTRLSDSQFVFDALSTVAQVAYSINHNLGNRAVTVSVYDEEYKLIGPDGIELVDENTVNVTLAVEQRVYVVIQGVKAVAAPVIP